jgi:hypothetical protein
MSRPDDAGSFAEAVYLQMEPAQYAEEDLDFPLLKYLGALGQMFQVPDELAFSQWTMLMDVENIEDIGLAWLGQFVGTVVDNSLPPDEQRDQVREHNNWDRGSRPGMIMALRKVLGGDVPFVFHERKTSAYNMEIVIYQTAGTYDFLYTSEGTYDTLYANWPSYDSIYRAGNTDAIDAAIASQKPAGIVLTRTLRAGVSYGDTLDAGFTTYQEIIDTFDTCQDWIDFIPPL